MVRCESERAESRASVSWPCFSFMIWIVFCVVDCVMEEEAEIEVGAVE